MVNEWTRVDLPTVAEAAETYMAKGVYSVHEGIALVLDAVVAHLNANGGVPASCEDAALADRLERQAATISELQGSFLSVEADADRWRRAREIVEQERDQARRERDMWKEKCLDTYEALHDARAERDKAVARAEAAEARTTPAVTRAGVKNAIDTCFALAPKINTQVISDAVCDFLGVEAEPADPLLDKAQEFAALADWELTGREAELLHTVARHVLGQEEVRHVDQ